ncbi:hypothetical protein [Kitasatospora sp. NBC_01302]|uniref:hypothetical protein n=1 Tax=Kitasatospora sp. NBC_01302 TaxID=2903575 RepID=UPI002E13CFC7|nr:hypothetical protein OG294_03995 [Kitasatospora sp. NBC_01302]
MSKPVPYRIGAEVHCEGGGDCGRLERVVIDPLAGQVTHLVVGDRLVPVELIEPLDAVGEPASGHRAAAPDEVIRLRCTPEEVDRLEPAEETRYLPGGVNRFGYNPNESLLLPYYGLGVGGAGLAPALLTQDPGPTLVAQERIPPGEVQIRHGDRIEATDGAIGRVQGLVIDQQDHSVTHVLLQEGHLWGRKTVAIPIRETYWSGGVVKVRLTKSELGELPPVELDPGATTG